MPTQIPKTSPQSRYRIKVAHLLDKHYIRTLATALLITQYIAKIGLREPKASDNFTSFTNFMRPLRKRLIYRCSIVLQIVLVLEVGIALGIGTVDRFVVRVVP